MRADDATQFEDHAQASEERILQATMAALAAGTSGLIAPTIDIVADIEELTIDGVRMVFQNTPGTEAPAEMNTWFPDLKAFWAAENITGTIHNIYTLRGALVRDALEWSRQINKALYLFGREAEVMFASHSWPRWGNDRIQEVMRVQRDTYAHLNNGVMHLANQGVTINEIHRVYQVPQSLQRQWAARSYHGSVEHNSRAVINRYLGYWDGNPATLIPLAPKESAPLFVEMMGGADAIVTRAQQLMDDRRLPARRRDPQQDPLRRTRVTRLGVGCSLTPSSRWATSRRARVCATASWPPPSSSAQGSRPEPPPRAPVRTWSGP